MSSIVDIISQFWYGCTDLLHLRNASKADGISNVLSRILSERTGLYEQLFGSQYVSSSMPMQKRNIPIDLFREYEAILAL